tara:strand:+ start:507 stop:1271 length:765 start_codon:yes stop_codon:yes gene_type:complete
MGFNLKSGNKPSFKGMGSSPLKATDSGQSQLTGRPTTGEITAEPAAEGKAYGGTKTWSEGQKDSGGTLNSVTKSQKAYEAKMSGENADWKKREDNTWKQNQNKINKHLGSTKVYDTVEEKKTKTVDGEQVMKGIGAKKGNTLTPEQKSAEKTNISIEKDKVAQAKSAEGGTDKNARDKAQMEIGDIKGGRDNEKTGTVVSRVAGKAKSKVNKAQLALRAKKEANKANKANKVKGSKAPKGTTIDVSDDTSNMPT